MSAKLKKGWTRQGFGETVRELVSCVDSCEIDCALVNVLVEESKSEFIMACRFDTAQPVP